jgi:AcrR family transcriptional regulator
MDDSRVNWTLYSLLDTVQFRNVPRSPGQRAGLSREAVLAAARALLDQEGLERLSMRRLADRLGVAPNALYSHVAGRTELIDALLDDTLGEVEAPDLRDGDWRAGLEAIMRRTYAVLLSHPDLVPLYLARRARPAGRRARRRDAGDDGARRGGPRNRPARPARAGHPRDRLRRLRGPGSG